jgi:hypothetical protein
MAYFEISSAYPYEYEFSYELYDTISWVKDLEPNNYFNEAIRINPGEIKTGRVRHYEDQVPGWTIIHTMMLMIITKQCFLRTVN